MSDNFTEKLNASVEHYSATIRTQASHRDSYQNVGGSGISGRPGLTQRDYDLWRPDEARARSQKGRMLQSDMAYHDIGLVKNMIDLMGDLACQGIRVSHPNKRIERFYRAWFKRVNGKDRSERFLNTLFRLGNVVIRMQTADIKNEQKEQLMKTTASPEVVLKDLSTTKNEIPIKYTFLYPPTVDVIGGALAAFVGDTQYVMKVPNHIHRSITRSTKNLADAEKALINKLPKDIKEAVRTKKVVPLPRDKTFVYHYKKDDWLPWGEPMLGSILTDLSLFTKLKLADKAALDGAISNIRIFKIGNLEHKIPPTPEAAQKLADILQGNVEAGTIDLIWGPDLELVESKTTVHKFLGEDKYKPTLTSIYGGLGIPATLTGTGGGGTTNNFISLKTLTQRLQYGRDVLMDFWLSQIKLVQDAMGFRLPAKIEFEFTNLGDEQAEKALLIQLADRNLISQELLQHKFGNDPELERVRINREQRDRDSGSMLPKASPFHDPQFGLALKKIALTTGVLAPSEVGIRLDENRKDLKKYPKEKGEKNALQMRQPAAKVSDKKNGVSQQGRPKNSKDGKKRKEKTFKPKTRAAIEIWARVAQEAIADYINPSILEMYKKKNMRSLSNKQVSQAEEMKFSILCGLKPMLNIDQDFPTRIQAAIDTDPDPIIKTTYQEWVSDISTEINRSISIDERKHVQSALYALYIGEDDG